MQFQGSPIELDDKINQKIGKLMPGNYANLISERKHFDCELLFESNIHDLPAPTLIKKPFKEIPDSLIEDYTYGGRIQVKSYYIERNFPASLTSSAY